MDGAVGFPEVLYLLAWAAFVAVVIALAWCIATLVRSLGIRWGGRLTRSWERDAEDDFWGDDR